MCSGEEIGENNDSQNDEEEWPPFRRVGTFDPYSDDPRLAVKRVRKHINYLSKLSRFKILSCCLSVENWLLTFV